MTIALLQALYNPSYCPLPQEDAYYESALTNISRFGIQSQVYFLLKQQNRLQETPAFFQEQLCQAYTAALYQNIFIKNQTRQIFQAFESLQIEVIPLKGVVFAEKYFGHIGARSTSDIDILVKESDIYRAIQCVKELGFTEEEEMIPSHFHCSFSKLLPGSEIPLTVEIHWHLLKKHTSSLRMADFWEHATPLPSFQHVKELSIPHTFYMICLHGWKHNLNSLKYFLDVIQIISVATHEFNYETLCNEAKNHKTYKRVWRTLSIVYHVFPELVHLKELPFQQKSNLWWEYSFICETKITYKQYISFLYFTFLDFDTYTHRLYALLNWIVPSRVELEFELGRNVNKDRLLVEYSKLYKKRLLSFTKTIFRVNLSQ
ncbi:nucleotidyltransferase family protein [Ectobacillus sp. JY-23]|uniref:nucleotidyltransferase family protein n=1 Tax=Ectobacillus sp. JY-23 TaxID=2933872 RepID=UPI001FF4A15E|nr:nucleotidyltransferase family protein [Ectobacillus sp. JY-23]UOY93326.1 nucleotidyltransferase family protein [Ectobacillus sp. JY-23]